MRTKPVIRLTRVANAMPHDRDTTAASDSSGRPAARRGAGPRRTRGGGGGVRCGGGGPCTPGARGTRWPGPGARRPVVLHFRSPERRGARMLVARAAHRRRAALVVAVIGIAQRDLERVRAVQIGTVGLAAEPVPQPSPGEQRQHRAGAERDEEQHLAVGVGMHRQPHRLTQRQPVRGAQRHVHRHPLGEVHLDGHPQRQVARRQLDLAHVGHRHAGRGVDCKSHPDRHRQVVAQRQRQRAALGRQRVGAAGVDDGHRAEQVVDRRRRPSSAAAGPARCGRRAAPTG